MAKEVKEVLKRLKGHLVRICYYVPETSIDECVQGILEGVNDSIIHIKTQGSEVWLTNIVVYLVEVSEIS